jgi:hypothetical protein
MSASWMDLSSPAKKGRSKVEEGVVRSAASSAGMEFEAR